MHIASHVINIYIGVDERDVRHFAPWQPGFSIRLLLPDVSEWRHVLKLPRVWILRGDERPHLHHRFSLEYVVCGRRVVGETAYLHEVEIALAGIDAAVLLDEGAGGGLQGDIVAHLAVTRERKETEGLDSEWVAGGEAVGEGEPP